jgi:heat shock protein HtpX
VTEAAAEPVLVYDRVAANRGASRRLLTLFTLLTLPFVGGLIPLLAPAIHFGVLEPTLGKAVLARLHATGEGAVLTFAASATLAVLVVVVASIAVSWLEIWQATRLVLRVTRARPIRHEDAPELCRLVENLSLAAGLSHIGNQDSRLNTLFAGVLAVLRLPLALLTASGLFRSLLVVKACLILSGLMTVVAALSMLAILIQVAVALWLFPGEVRDFLAAAGQGNVLLVVLVEAMIFYGPLLMGSPFYVLFGAQLCGRRVGGAVSRRREFLADADAVLLTRDPEGLALALVTVGAARSGALDVWNATAHLFFVEPPASATGWWDRSVESHPSIEARVEALGQMGSGISPEAIERARAAGERFRAAGPRDISATSRT